MAFRRSTFGSSSSEHGFDLITKRHDNDPIDMKSSPQSIQPSSHGIKWSKNNIRTDKDMDPQRKKMVAVFWLLWSQTTLMIEMSEHDKPLRALKHISQIKQETTLSFVISCPLILPQYPYTWCDCCLLAVPGNFHPISSVPATFRVKHRDKEHLSVKVKQIRQVASCTLKGL